ncbi:MAG: SDR family oxidoreductase [Lentisphaeria bacterium]|nr:SDR family oxidoreductase [Lentisphaeria bacterium]
MEEVPVTMPGFEGKRVMVTGAAQRLGAVIARAFADRGAAVVVHCFRSRDDAERLVASLPPCPEPLRHEVVSCDLADLDAVRRMAEAVGPVDCLVNNAAMWIRGDAPQPELDRQEAVNRLAPVELIRLFAHMCPQEREFSAVNILDAATLSGAAPASPYEAAKAALRRDTLALALELAPRVRVNAVAPGPVFPPRELGSAGLKHIPATLPLKAPVDPADIARAVIFLASAKSVTGAVLPVDCGQSLLFQQPMKGF